MHYQELDARNAELVQIVGSYPPEKQDRFLRIAKKIHRVRLVDSVRVGAMAGNDRRSEVIETARLLRKAGMISGFEFLLIRLGFSILYKLIERVLFGDEK